MATVTGLTAERMLEIEAASVVDGEVVSGNLILTKHDGTTINAGPVLGPAGPTGPAGPAGGLIPGEIKMWPGSALPDPAQYGKWVWADGAYYPVATYPKAAANIAPQWRTFAGASDPGAANFRVPDVRGLVPAGLDAMPGGSRANRMTRAVAITIAAKTGEETHVITLPEMVAHAHGANANAVVNESPHTHLVSRTPSFTPGGTSAFNSNGAIDNGYGEVYNAAGYVIPVVTGVSVAVSVAVQNAGGNGAHENVQPTVFIPYIVKLDD